MSGASGVYRRRTTFFANDDEGLNGKDDLRRELKQLGPWPNDLWFEDGRVEAPFVMRLSRPDNPSRSLIGSSMLPVCPDNE
jgi:hypothetical protein